MAITIKVEPQDFTPAYNEVMVVLDSTNKSEPKFQYVVDINVGGVYSSRIKVQSNPAGYGVVNLSKHLESYVSSNIDIADKTLFKKITDSYIDYDIDLSEEYVLTTSFTSVTDNGGFCQYNYASPHNFVDGDFVTISSSSVPAYDGVQEITSVPSTTAIVTTEVYSATATGDSVLSNNTTTIIPDAAVFSSTKYVLNNVVNWVDFPNFTIADYDISVASKGSLLTNLNEYTDVKMDDRITAHFYNPISGNAAYLYVVSNNGTFRYTNTHSSTTASTKFVSVGVAPFDLLNDTPAVISGSLPVIDGDTTDYYVYLASTIGTRSSEIKYFKIDRRCTEHDNYKLMYLNKEGSFSTFNFDLASEENVSVTKTKYNKNYGEYNSVANKYTYASSDRGVSVIDTDISENYTITSNYISESAGRLIKDLISSPEVYHLADNTYTYDTPVGVNTISDNGGFVQINSGVHGYNIGDVILLENFTNPTFNASYVVTSVPSTTSLVINKTWTGGISYGGTEQMSKRIFDTDGALRAIDITTSSAKIKKRLTDRLINYTISFTYSNKNQVQR